MRAAAAALVLLSASGIARGDGSPRYGAAGAGVEAAAAPGASDVREARAAAVELRRTLRAARIQRNLGWGLSVLGVVLDGAGAITATWSAYQEGYHVRELITGIVLAAAGLAVLIPGVVLALRGQDGVSAAEHRLRTLAPLLAPVPALGAGTPDGILAGARLRF